MNGLGGQQRSPTGKSIVPFSVELIAFDPHCGKFLVGDLDPSLLGIFAQLRTNVKAYWPDFVVVLPIRLTTTSRLTKERPRQLFVIWQNIRCSIVFHLLLPGGK